MQIEQESLELPVSIMVFILFWPIMQVDVMNGWGQISGGTIITFFLVHYSRKESRAPNWTDSSFHSEQKRQEWSDEMSVLIPVVDTGN